MLAMLSHRTEGSIRRVPAAPTMDWTDDHQIVSCINGLARLISFRLCTYSLMHGGMTMTKVATLTVQQWGNSLAVRSWLLPHLETRRFSGCARFLVPRPPRHDMDQLQFPGRSGDARHSSATRAFAKRIQCTNGHRHWSADDHCIVQRNQSLCSSSSGFEGCGELHPEPPA